MSNLIYDRRRVPGGRVIKTLRRIHGNVRNALAGPMHPVLTVVIPAYGQQDLVGLAVDSVRASVLWPYCEVVVVDDASPEPIELRGVKVVRNDRNLGFAGACNVGARAARGAFLLFLNSDATIERGALEELLECAHTGHAIVGGRVMDAATGELQAAGFDWNRKLQSHVYASDPGVADGACYVEAVPGSFMMVRRRDFNELGGFSTAYGRGYFEDVDLCLRAWESGRSVWYADAAIAHHRGSASMSGGKPDADLLGRSHRVFLETWVETGRLEKVRGTSITATEWPKVAVIVTVHNALSQTKRCLEAATTDYGGLQSVRWVIVDDCSEPGAAEELRRYVSGLFYLQGSRRDAVLDRRDGHPGGYMWAALRGVQLSHQAFPHMEPPDHLVFLNSDTVPTRGWLGKMVATAESDPKIAMVNPLCNEAANLSVDLGRGFDLEAMRLAAVSAALDEAPDVAYPVGMCLLVRTTAWNELGGFDVETYPQGYGEETDLAHRALEAGWRCVVAPAAFVYHEGKGSHGDRGRKMEQEAVQKFLKKHGESARRRLSAFERSGVMERLRTAVHAAVPMDRRPGVVFYSNELQLCGGVLATYRLAAGLQRLGWRAVVAGKNLLDHHKMEHAGLMAPMIYGNAREFTQQFLQDQSVPPAGGFLVATVYFTAEMVAGICKESGGRWRPVYFVQDDESRFKYPDGTSYSRPGEVAGTYKLIENKVANSAWVQEVLKEAGHESALIPVGVDPDQFYPRPKDDRFTVIAMCRHTTPRRGYELLRKVAKGVKQADPSIRFVVYGQRPRNEDRRWMEHVGFLQQNELADIMGRAHVLLEPSSYQGFGLPALEGMASGCLVISTPNKGIDTYGEHGVNCLIRSKPSAIIESIAALPGLPALRLELTKHGRRTAEAFSWAIAAQRWNDYLRGLLEG